MNSHPLISESPATGHYLVVLRRFVEGSIGELPTSTTISAALVEVEPGLMWEMHWHPNNDEW